MRTYGNFLSSRRRIALEDERFDFGAGDDVIEVAGPAHQDAGLRFDVGAGSQIAADAIAQHLRLADVQHLALGVLEEIDARLLGRQAHLLGQVARIDRRFVRHVPSTPPLQPEFRWPAAVQQQ